jgi:hypothetical protein
VEHQRHLPDLLQTIALEDHMAEMITPDMPIEQQREIATANLNEIFKRYRTPLFGWAVACTDAPYFVRAFVASALGVCGYAERASEEEPSPEDN